MIRRGLAVVAAVVSLLTMSSCDILEPNTGHGGYGGYQGCNVDAQHKLIGNDYFRSHTYEDQAYPCARVAARVYAWGYDGIYYGTPWAWDGFHAGSNLTGVSSDKSEHLLCKNSTPCGGGSH